MERSISETDVACVFRSMRSFPSLGWVERSITETEVAFFIGVSPSASVVGAPFSPRTSIGYLGRGPSTLWGAASTTGTDEPDEKACVSQCLGRGRGRAGTDGRGVVEGELLMGVSPSSSYFFPRTLIGSPCLWIGHGIISTTCRDESVLPDEKATAGWAGC